MTKQIFLDQLRAGLYGLPQDDIEERVSFYSEMIDDRMEEGLTEEAAVAGIGPVDTIISQIIAETPLPRLVREQIKSRPRMRAWEVILLILGFPLWFPLLIAAFAVIFSVYVVIWSVILVLWAVEIACIAGAFAGVIVGFIQIFQGNLLFGLLLISAAVLLSGLSILLFFGCIAAAKGALYLTKKVALGIKSLFLRKENSK
ncbi:MAG: DUF1700 domain-containing protein [Firmicutes bacterium]|nr:DUF1700 domain-containing protein [Bacillota bacterium]